LTGSDALSRPKRLLPPPARIMPVTSNLYSQSLEAC